MKKIIVLMLLIFTQVLAQTKDTQRYDIVFSQIEQAFDSGNLNNIWALLNSSVTLRIEDSLYRDESDIRVESLLKSFFEAKDSIKFRFVGNMYGAENNGVLSYTIDNKRSSLNVDVYLSSAKGEILIYALNFSNYPSSTVFDNLLEINH